MSGPRPAEANNNNNGAHAGEAGPSVPTVDVEEWRTATPMRRHEIAVSLDRALRETGMFLLDGHGVPREITDAFRAAAREFFALSRESKSPLAIEAPYDSGWLEMHPGGGVGVSRSEDDGSASDAPDLHESFYVTASHSTGDPRHDRLCYPTDRWPAELPALRVAADAYTAHMVRLAGVVNEILAEVLGLASDYFTSRATQATWTQNASWYPSLSTVGSVQDGQLRNGPHTDLGTFTLLSRQQGVGGLQAWTEQHGWFPPPYGPDLLIVNLGDLMEHWTDGRWRALWHRVLSPSSAAPDEELLSLVFFYETDPSTLIEPMPSPVGGGAGLAPLVARRPVLEKLGVDADPLPNVPAASENRS